MEEIHFPAIKIYFIYILGQFYSVVMIMKLFLCFIMWFRLDHIKSCRGDIIWQKGAVLVFGLVAKSSCSRPQVMMTHTCFLFVRHIFEHLSLHRLPFLLGNLSLCLCFLPVPSRAASSSPAAVTAESGYCAWDHSVAGPWNSNQCKVFFFSSSSLTLEALLTCLQWISLWAFLSQLTYSRWCVMI